MIHGKQSTPQSNKMWPRLYIFLIGFSYMGCMHTDPQDQSRVWVESIRPIYMVAGSTISIAGGGYGLEGDEDGVWVAGEALDILYWSENRIDCRLPSSVAGEVFLVIRSGAYTSDPLPLMINTIANDFSEQTPDQELDQFLILEVDP